MKKIKWGVIGTRNYNRVIMKKVCIEAIVFAHMHTFLPFLLELESNTNYNGGSCFVKDRRYIILGE